MSRGSVFKLSGNLALGAGSTQPASDIDDIKNSLKLLKAKQSQRKSDYDGGQGQYGGYQQQGYEAPSSRLSGQVQSRTGTYDYEAASKNHIPNSYLGSGATTMSSKGMPSQDTHGMRAQNDYAEMGVAKTYSQQQRDPYARERAQQQPQPQQRDPYAMDKKQTYGSDRDIMPPQRQPATHEYKREQQQQQPAYERPAPQRSREPDRQPQRQVQNQRSQPQPPPQQNRRGMDQAPKGNLIEQMSLKEANKQNKVQIIEYNQNDLMECREGCGRRFNPDSIGKHENVCKKVFQKKRKEFNAQEHRLVAKDQKKLMKKGQQVEKKLQAQKNNEKMAKWKAESMRFRAALKQGNGQKITREEQEVISAAQNQGLVKCSYCGRSFNEKAAEKHVVFCQNQVKKNQMKAPRR